MNQIFIDNKNQSCNISNEDDNFQDHINSLDSYASFRFKSIHIHLMCQYKIKSPANYMILFIDRNKFLKMSPLLRKYYHGKSLQILGTQNGLVQSAEHLSGFTSEIFLLHFDIPFTKNMSQSSLEEIQINLSNQIKISLQYMRVQKNPSPIRIVLPTNSIYSEIFDHLQQAQIFVQALLNLEDSKKNLEICIVSQNKLELCAYSSELLRHEDIKIYYSESKKQQKYFKLRRSQTDSGRNQRKCLIGHHLTFTSETYLTLQFQCQFCLSETVDTRYQCFSCTSYACVFCVPTPIDKFQCPKNHILTFNNNSNKERRYHCDECLINAVHVNNGVWSDESCDFDICGYCMREKIEVSLVQKKIIQLKALQNLYSEYFQLIHERYFRPEVLQDFGKFLNNESLKF